MEYVNKLTDDELIDLFKLFMASDEVFISASIDRFDNSISMNGYVKFPDPDDPEKLVECEDSYSLTDYYVKVYMHSEDVTPRFRKYMYDKFGNEYAKNFLLNYGYAIFQ